MVHMSQCIQQVKDEILVAGGGVIPVGAKPPSIFTSNSLISSVTYTGSFNTSTGNNSGSIIVVLL